MGLSLGSDFNFDFGVSFADGESYGHAEYNFEPIGYPCIDELPGMSAARPIVDRRGGNEE